MSVVCEQPVKQVFDIILALRVFQSARVLSSPRQNTLLCACVGSSAIYHDALFYQMITKSKIYGKIAQNHQFGTR